MSQTKEEIYSHLQGLMQTLFELDAADVTPTARLQEDLDLDSIDAVDLMIELKPLAGTKLDPKSFKGILTVQDIVDAIHQQLND